MLHLLAAPGRRLPYSLGLLGSRMRRTVARPFPSFITWTSPSLTSRGISLRLVERCTPKCLFANFGVSVFCNVAAR